MNKVHKYGCTTKYIGDIFTLGSKASDFFHGQNCVVHKNTIPTL